MTWIALGLLAGLVLGTYDFLTKLALKEKTVLEVVLWSSLLGSLIWLPFFFIPVGSVDAFRHATGFQGEVHDQLYQEQGSN